MKKYVVINSRCPKCGKEERTMNLISSENYAHERTGGWVKVVRLSKCCFVDEDVVLLITKCPDGCLMVGLEE